MRVGVTGSRGVRVAVWGAALGWVAGCGPSSITAPDLLCPAGMSAIPKGSFKLSDKGDVTVGAFCLDLTEVTVEAYAACVKKGACSADNAGSEFCEAPNAPRLLALLKPEACGLGGEVVLVAQSSSYENAPRGSRSSSHSYMVLRAKSTAPQAF